MKTTPFRMVFIIREKMRQLEPHEIEQLAMHCVKLNSRPGDSVEKLYGQYTSAIETIYEIERKATEDRIAKSGIRF